MKIFQSAILAFTFFTSPLLFATLPPLFEDLAEIKAILDDQRLPQMLESGESLQEIRKVKKGYVILTNAHKLFVKVIYLKNDVLGPDHFEFEFKRVY